MKLLGVNIDYGLTFDTHINEVNINLRHKFFLIKKISKCFRYVAVYLLSTSRRPRTFTLFYDPLPTSHMIS